MKQKLPLPLHYAMVLYPFIMVFLLALVFWLIGLFKINTYYLGIRPRNFEGLVGIFTSVFIHGNLQHLSNNLLPLFTLSLALFYFYNQIAWRVLVYGVLVSGVFTWLIGSKGVHIGASGLIYVLISFIFFKGIFTKNYRLTALSLLVVFFYGSFIWYVFPIKQGMSWEGHLSGLITGLIFALIFKKSVLVEEKYDWEQEGYNEAEDAFMKHFDEAGNFIEFPNEEDNSS